MKSLWPDDIPQDDLKSPAAILKEQASLLGPKTKNLVLADVKREEAPAYLDQYFQYSFTFVAPTLSGYRYKLFAIRYPIGFYPLTFTDVDDQIVKEVFSDSRGSEARVDSESDFLNKLEMILKSKKVTQIITTLRKEIGR